METVSELPRQRRLSLLGPALLIGLGAVLLLNRFGLLDWGVWYTLLQLWPLLLVAVGLELILAPRSALAGVLIPLALLAALAGALWWAGARPNAALGQATSAIEQPLAAVERAELKLALGVGELRLAAMDEPEGLIAGTLQGQAGTLPSPVSTVQDGVAFYTLQQRSDRFGAPWGSRVSGERWQLRLTREVPLHLTLDTGAGTTVADLAELRVTALHVNSGVGATELVMPRAGGLSGTINGGVGQTTITLPGGVAARLTIHRGLGDVRVPDGYTRRGDSYESPGFSEAAPHVELTINGGVGELIIKRGGG